MSINLILGAIVSLTFILSYIPQLKSLYTSKNIKGVSTIFWLLIAIATAITLHNLVSHSAVWYVTAPQAINALIALVILVWVAFKKRDIGTVFIYFMIYCFIITVFVFQNNFVIMQHGSSLLIFIAYLLQIITIALEKTSQGVNYLLFVGFGLGLAIMTINIIVTGAPVEAAYTEIINLIMITIATGTTIFYSKINKGIEDKRK